MHIIFLALPYVLQLLAIIHIFKTGRSTMWVYLLIFLPLVGGVAYLLLEILPGLQLDKKIPGISDIVANKMNPSLKLERLKKEAAFTPSFNNRKNLADEYVISGFFNEALAIYNELLVGNEKNNTGCLLMKAKTLYALKNYPEAAKIIDQLEELKFSYDRVEEFLVKIKIRENTKNKEQVEELFQQARTRFNSFEINYYYTEYLIQQGEAVRALEMIEEIKTKTEYLRKAKVTYDRSWAEKAIALQKRL